MDVHKPKPVHSWRGLLSEVGIIVLGVLIALTMSDTMTRAIGDPLEAQRPSNYEQPFNEGKPAPRGEPVPAKDAPGEIDVPHLAR